MDKHMDEGMQRLVEKDPRVHEMLEQVQQVAQKLGFHIAHSTVAPEKKNA